MGWGESVNWTGVKGEWVGDVNLPLDKWGKLPQNRTLSRLVLFTSYEVRTCLPADEIGGGVMMRVQHGCAPAAHLLPTGQARGSCRLPTGTSPNCVLFNRSHN